jgi:hypothetical protein
VEREYWFFRDIETFVILDRLQTDTAARSRTFVIHCETNPKLVDDAHLLCVNGDQQLSVTSLLPAKPSSRTVVDDSKVANPTPAQNVQYRIEINDTPNATLSYTLHVLQAMDASGTPLAPTLADSAPSTPESGTLTVTLDAKHSLTITKGKTSAGGSVAINGQSSDLRKDVAPFTIGADNMPVWGPYSDEDTALSLGNLPALRHRGRRTTTTGLAFLAQPALRAWVYVASTIGYIS